MTFQDELLEFLSGWPAASIPDAARQRAVDAIADGIACLVLGAQEPLEAPLRQGVFGPAVSPAAIAAALTDHPAAGGLASADEALALYLGTLVHAADFDDISHPAYCHPTAVLLGPLLLRAGALNLEGRDLIGAYVAGIEVFGQLGRRLNMDHYRRGWHATGTFGAIAATAALCALERLPPDQAGMALGIAASMASGLQENFGTPTKPLHAGLAGRSALLATRLARAGYGSSATALDGPKGFARVFGGAPGIAEPKPWGEPPEILTENGLAIKAYPSCAATHAAIDATLAAREQLGPDRINPAEVAEIRVGASRHALQPLIHDWPSTPLEAKFCMRHCVAAALLDGRVSLSNFTPASLARPALHTMMRRVTVQIDPRVAEDPEFAAVVEVVLTNGRKAEVQVDVARGKPGNWLSKAALRDKFILCAGPEQGRAAALYDTVQRLGEPAGLQAVRAGLADLLGAVLARDGQAAPAAKGH